MLLGQTLREALRLYSRRREQGKQDQDFWG
jgi:hypothetical protein